MERNTIKRDTYFKDKKADNTDACPPSGLLITPDLFSLQREEMTFCTDEGKTYKLILDVDTDTIKLEKL